MATVYQHPSSKFYFARFTDPATGRRVSKSTKCIAKKAAKIVAGKLQSAANDEALRADVPRILQRAVEHASLEAQLGTLTLQRAEDLIRLMATAANPTAKEGTFKRFAGHWLDEREKDVTAQSYTDYHRAVKVATAALGDKSEQPFRRITTMDVEGIRGAFAATGATGCTVNKQFAVIRRIFQSAVDCGALDLNPAKSIKAASTSDSTERRPFTPPEVRSLIEAADSDEWKGLIVLACQTGLRRGDLLALTHHNVNDEWLTIQTGKTGAVVSMPLSAPCLAWLQDRPSGQLFPALAKVKAAKLSLRFDEIMGKADVPKVVVIIPGDVPKVGSRSFHSLRHSFISWLAQMDVNADVRMKLSGHSSEAVHAGYTDHGDALKRAVSQLPVL